MKLWFAQGFGIGRIPIAPGTFGSLVGVLWLALLLLTGRWWVLAGGSLAGVALSVWLCSAAEKELGQKDPASVVLDEIAALPICFFGWVGVELQKAGSLPGLSHFFATPNWLVVIGIFAAFRFFDVVKPWPIRQSQALPGGWGVTADDLLAAVYVNGIVLLAHFFLNTIGS